MATVAASPKKRILAQHLLEAGYTLRAQAKAVAVSRGRLRDPMRQGQLLRPAADVRGRCPGERQGSSLSQCSAEDASLVYTRSLAR